MLTVTEGYIFASLSGSCIILLLSTWFVHDCSEIILRNMCYHFGFCAHELKELYIHMYIETAGSAGKTFLEGKNPARGNHQKLAKDQRQKELEMRSSSSQLTISSFQRGRVQTTNQKTHCWAWRCTAAAPHFFAVVARCTLHVARCIDSYIHRENHRKTLGK